jgi:hypothetical protein
MVHPDQLVESYRFWDAVALWAHERKENEAVIARLLARAVVVDGLRLHSVDTRWMNAERCARGYPYVGYAAMGEGSPARLRADALEHLLRVVRGADEPRRELLTDEFFLKTEFRIWLRSTEQALPAFWFSAGDRGILPAICRATERTAHGAEGKRS